MFGPGPEVDINLKMYKRNLFDYGWLDEVAINRSNCGGAKAGSIRFNQNTRPLMRVVGGTRLKVTALESDNKDYNAEQWGGVNVRLSMALISLLHQIINAHFCIDTFIVLVNQKTTMETPG